MVKVEVVLHPKSLGPQEAGKAWYSFEAYNRNAVANATRAANTERLSDERPNNRQI